MSWTTRDVSMARPLAPMAEIRPVERAARLLTLLTIAVAGLMLAGAFGLALYGYSHRDRLYEGIAIAGVDVGGMEREAAAAAITARFDVYADQPIMVEAAGQTFMLTPREAGAVLDVEATLDRAFAFGRDGSFWDRSARWARALLGGTTLRPVIRVDGATLEAEISGIATSVDRAPSDAYVAMEAESPELVPDIPGVTLDRDAARALFTDRFASLSAEPLSLPATIVPAAISSDILREAVPGAQAAVGSPLVVASAEGSWALSPEELRQIVAVNETGEVVVDRASLEAFIQSIAVAVDRPAVNADVRLNEDLSLTVVPGSYSAEVDVGATVDAAAAALLAGEHDVVVTIARNPPAITDADAVAAIAEAEALIGAGIAVSWSGQVEAGEARLGRDDLVQALVIEPRPESDQRFSIVIDPWLLSEVITPMQEEIDVPAIDAAFRLVDGEVTVVSQAKDGQTLDLMAAASAIVEAVSAGQESVKLPVEDDDPEYTAADRTRIRLPDQLGDSATYYGTSSEPRRQNVERAVELENGWLIPPGGVFSYVEHVGRIDETNGFTTGFGIVADEERGGVTTAPVIGGGICQVSTTIFQAAFWAGLGIEERWQHPYWLPGYGNPPRGMKGLDAMVNVEDDWALDLKIRNTTDNWIGIVVIGDGENVTAQILGTDPGWEVRVDEPVITNVVPKDDRVYYVDSPELPAGQELQVETAGEGFDAMIKRTVLDDGEVIDEYVVESSFAASRNTILRGTGS